MVDCETARLNIFGRVTSVANRRVGKFEDSVTTTATSEELSTTRNRKSAYAKAFILDPGRYRVDVIRARHPIRRCRTQASRICSAGVPRRSPFGFEHCPRSQTREHGSAAPQLVHLSSARPKSYQISQAFTGAVNRSAIYLQVYNAAIDQTTLRPAADAEYVLLKNGKELSKQVEDWRQINDAGQRLTLTRLIDTATWNPAEYRDSNPHSRSRFWSNDRAVSDVYIVP